MEWIEIKDLLNKNEGVLTSIGIILSVVLAFIGGRGIAKKIIKKSKTKQLK